MDCRCLEEYNNSLKERSFFPWYGINCVLYESMIRTETLDPNDENDDRFLIDLRRPSSFTIVTNLDVFESVES